MAVTVQAVPAAVVYPMRHAILRPNQRFDECRFPGDDDSDTVHCAAFDGHAVVGIASVYSQPMPGNDETRGWRLRGMATAPELRRSGIGGQLLSFCIAHAVNRNGVLIWCNARTPAVPFYERFGFACEGDEFEIEGIGPHYVMVKQLGDADG
jgi:GNAT superfamily N-acetyltransferase